MREYWYGHYQHNNSNNRNIPLCDLSLHNVLVHPDCNYKINAIIIEDAAAAPTVTAYTLPRDPEVSVADVVSVVIEQGLLQTPLS